MEHTKAKEKIKTKNEILQLLCKYKSTSLMEFNILEFVLFEKPRIMNENDPQKHNPNLELLKIFTNEPFSLSLNKSIIDKAVNIETLKEPFIEFLLNNPSLYNQSKQPKHQVKKLKLSYVHHDVKTFATNNQRDNVDDDEDDDTETTILKLELYQFLIIKSTKLQNQLLNLKLVNIKNEYSNIDISNGNNERIKQLYHQYFQIATNERSNIKKDHLISRHFRTSLNSLPTISRLPELTNLPTNKQEKVCEVYLIKYDQAIKGLGINGNFILKYALEKLSVNAIKYILSLDEKELLEINRILPYQTIEISDINFGITSEFIKLYTSIVFSENGFQSKSIDHEICKFIYSASDETDYQKLVDSISNPNFKKYSVKQSIFKYLSNVSSPMSELLIIRDKERIDWIRENYSLIQIQIEGAYSFTFMSIELIEYAKLKFKLPGSTLSLYFSKINKSRQLSIYIDVFGIAINNCDVESLKYISSNFNGKFTDYQLNNTITTNCDNIYQDDDNIKQSINNIKFDNHRATFNFKGQSTSNIIQLLDYLNSTGYSLFSEALFRKFVKSIFAVSTNNGGIIDLSKLSIPFNGNLLEANSIFYELITEINSLDKIKLVLNGGFNPFSTKSELESLKFYSFDSTLNKSIIGCTPGHYFFSGLPQSCLYYYQTFKKDDRDVLFAEINYCTSGESSINIIEVIDYFMEMFNQYYSTMVFESTVDLLPLLMDGFQSLINHLFKRLIKISNINFQTVDNVYQNIKSNWLKTTLDKPFQFQHTLYHSFYYLGIKSLKNIKFLFSLPSNYHLFGGYFNTEPCIKYYDEIMYNNINGFNDGDIFKYLDINQLSYEFIFNSSSYNGSESIILEILINQLMERSFIDIKSKLPAKNYRMFEMVEDLYIQSLESTLCYLLDVKEITLFFKQLDKIRIQLNGQHPLSDLLSPPSEPYFNYHNKLVKKAIHVLDFDQFEQFCKFDSFKSIKYWYKMNNKLADNIGNIRYDFKLKINRLLNLINPTSL